MIKELFIQKKINMSAFNVVSCLEYETIMGSNTYGVAGEQSDIDIYAVCIPPKELLFPHMGGFIEEFDTVKNIFSDYQQHHIMYNENQYDIFLYSITKFFRLCMQNNPNMIDSLFTDQNFVLTMTPIGEKIRQNRTLFLHKGLINRYIGYADAQIKRLDNKKRNRKPLDIPYKYGYDVKFAYHIIRLLNEAEQLIKEQNLDLKRNCDVLQSVRNGEWSLSQVTQYVEDKKNILKKAEQNTKLAEAPPTKKIKQLLLECLEEKYGNLELLP